VLRRERDNLPSGVYRINMRRVHIPTHIPSKERQSINLINSSHYTYTLAVPQLLYILPTEDIWHVPHIHTYVSPFIYDMQSTYIYTRVYTRRQKEREANRQIQTNPNPTTTIIKKT